MVYFSRRERYCLCLLRGEKKICVVIKQCLIYFYVRNQIFGKNEILVLPLSQVLAKNFVLGGEYVGTCCAIRLNLMSRWAMLNVLFLVCKTTFLLQLINIHISL